MSQGAVSSRRAWAEHSVAVPGGTIYYRTQGSGPPLVLIGGGPSNADTLAALAGQLAADHTVITYDRRGYSRSRLADPSQPASIAVHANDVRHIVEDLGAGAPSVFATSVGALIGLELAASHPDAVARLIVHEPPL
jgi:pimeloyl-ACP methyl ester carboxylesterase